MGTFRTDQLGFHAVGLWSPTMGTPGLMVKSPNLDEPFEISRRMTDPSMGALGLPQTWALELGTNHPTQLFGQPGLAHLALRFNRSSSVVAADPEVIKVYVQNAQGTDEQSNVENKATLSLNVLDLTFGNMWDLNRTSKPMSKLRLGGHVDVGLGVGGKPNGDGKGRGYHLDPASDNGLNVAWENEFEGGALGLGLGHFSGAVRFQAGPFIADLTLLNLYSNNSYRPENNDGTRGDRIPRGNQAMAIEKGDGTLGYNNVGVRNNWVPDIFIGATIPLK